MPVSSKVVLQTKTISSNYKRHHYEKPLYFFKYYQILPSNSHSSQNFFSELSLRQWSFHFCICCWKYHIWAKFNYQTKPYKKSSKCYTW